MKTILPNDTKLTAPMVLRWAKKYPIEYDDKHYYPWIDKARGGDHEAFKRITEWKNVGNGPRPMRLACNKLISLKSFLCRLKTYRAANGRQALEHDFMRKAPVYSIFWAHVLYDSPIFDVYTYVAYAYFRPTQGGQRLTKRAAKIKPRSHWVIYASYEKWFNETLMALKSEDPTIDARTLDRALFKWGRHYSSDVVEKIASNTPDIHRLSRKEQS